MKTENVRHILSLGFFQICIASLERVTFPWQKVLNMGKASSGRPGRGCVTDAPSGMSVCVEPSTISFLEKMLPASIRDAGGDARATMWDGRPRPSLEFEHLEDLDRAP